MSEAAEDLATDPELNLIDAIYARRSVRGYLDREVPRKVLDRIFEIAQQSPSNCNVQPWKVYVATGALKDRLRDQMVANTSSRVPPNPDYEYRGDFVDEYRKRQVECAVYRKAIELGATCEGPSGPRGESFYAGYFRDLEGNKLNVFCMMQSA